MSVTRFLIFLDILFNPSVPTYLLFLTQHYSFGTVLVVPLLLHAVPLSLSFHNRPSGFSQTRLVASLPRTTMNERSEPVCRRTLLTIVPRERTRTTT